MKPHIVVLDDDELICDFWEKRCHNARRKVSIFRCHRELFGAIPKLPNSSTLFIDKNLQGKSIGIAVSKQLFSAGFKNLYLSTAEDLKLQPAVTWIKGFVGKTPPEWLFRDAITTPLSHEERQYLLAMMSPQQLSQYKSRMSQFLEIIHGSSSGAFAGPDLSGFNIPEIVLNAWERSITMSLSDDQIKSATDHAWRLS
jgi:hypothetical protein